MGVTTNPDLTGLPDASVTGIPENTGGGGTPGVLRQINAINNALNMDYFMYSGDFHGIGTQFVAGSSMSIGNVIITRMKKSGSPDVNIVIRIYEGAGPTDASDFDPAALLGESEPIAASTLVAHPESGSVCFTFATPVPVTSGNTYCICIETTDVVTWDGSNYFVVYMQPAALEGANAVTGLSSTTPQTWEFDGSNDDILMTVCT